MPSRRSVSREVDTRLDSEETLPALIDELAEINCTVPGVTPDGGPLEGTPVLEPLEHSGPEMSSHDNHMEEAPVLEPLLKSIRFWKSLWTVDHWREDR